MKYTSILRGAVRIIAPSMIGAVDASIGLAKKIPAQLEREVDKQVERGQACETAREIVARYGDSPAVTEYIKTYHTSIGTDIYKSREAKCAKFTKNYLQFFFEKAEREGAFEAPPVKEVIEKGVIPHMPSMPSLPKVTDIGGDIKRSIQVSALVLIGVVLLIIYMLTGRGKKGVTVVT